MSANHFFSILTTAYFLLFYKQGNRVMTFSTRLIECPIGNCGERGKQIFSDYIHSLHILRCFCLSLAVCLFSPQYFTLLKSEDKAS